MQTNDYYSYIKENVIKKMITIKCWKCNYDPNQTFTNE